MNVNVVAVLLSAVQIVAGFSHCEKNFNIDNNVAQYVNMNIEDFGLIHVSRDEVTFRLWTRDQKNVFQPIYYGHLRDEESIRPKNPFKFIIHGWTDCANAEWCAYIKDEYLKKDDYNVILVDWAKPAAVLYPLSAGYTKEVGKFIGEFIMDLNNTLGVPYENIHLVGHSLGAHISGFAGKNVLKSTGRNIGRITGLDTAGPMFLLAGSRSRLSTGDAKVVDNIHTDGGKFGYMNSIGDIDIYPNGGTAPQPGCLVYQEYTDVIDVASCSHTRSYYLFAESINTEKFIARKCSSILSYNRGDCNNNEHVIMGENNDFKERGRFYLTTNPRSLFARNGAI